MYLQVVTLFSFTFYLPSGLEGLPGHIVIVLLSQRENGRQERLITLTIGGQSISQVSTKQKQKYLKKKRHSCHFLLHIPIVSLFVSLSLELS